MGAGSPDRLRQRRLAVGFTVVALTLVGAFAAGVGVARLTIVSGSESGSGSLEPTSAVTWWSEQAVAIDLIPLTAPTNVSAAVGAPTVLPGTNATLALGPTTAGHAAMRWDFVEKTAPSSTEFVLALTLVNATTGATTVWTGYLSTQGNATATLTFSLFVDRGLTAGPLRAASEVVQQCASTGSCP